MASFRAIYFTIWLVLANLGLIIAYEDASRQIRKTEQAILNGGHNASQPIDITLDSAFRGLTTFADLSYVNCVADESAKYDIAIVGAPFDTAVTGRPGTRFGPTGIRLGSRRIKKSFAASVYTHLSPYLSWARIVDCGDAGMTFLDNTIALKQLELTHRALGSRKVNDTSRGQWSRTITLGGDHTTTLAALRAGKDKWKEEVAVIHFDSHLDTWDPELLGSESGYAGINHGTFLHIAHEEGLLLANRSLHVGIRAPISGTGDLDNDARCGFAIITARDIDLLTPRGIIDKIKKRVGNRPVYLSVDIDVLDPAFAPGTGTAEVGGWSTRELLTILDGLGKINIVGADIVEVSPPYDTNGEITVLAAAEIVQSFLTLMVNNPLQKS